MIVYLIYNLPFLEFIMRTEVFSVFMQNKGRIWMSFSSQQLVHISDLSELFKELELSKKA